MNVTPTPVTAALAGVFSGLTWPMIWPHVTGTEASATLWLVLATIVLVALLTRIGTWLAGGVVTALLVAAFRGAA